MYSIFDAIHFDWYLREESSSLPVTLTWWVSLESGKHGGYIQHMGMNGIVISASELFQSTTFSCPVLHVHGVVILLYPLHWWVAHVAAIVSYHLSLSFFLSLSLSLSLSLCHIHICVQSPLTHFPPPSRQHITPAHLLDYCMPDIVLCVGCVGVEHTLCILCGIRDGQPAFIHMYVHVLECADLDLHHSSEST